MFFVGCAKNVISIHAPRVGSDTGRGCYTTRKIRISIHAPRVGSDLEPPHWVDVRISIHAPRVGSDEIVDSYLSFKVISIHAPRVGSDPITERENPCPLYFNPRSPCGERRIGAFLLASHEVFQSTLPVWGATSLRGYHLPCPRDFNPRSPCGERHADGSMIMHSIDFNPRSPCGERPRLSAPTGTTPGISIHAPRVGSDVADQRIVLGVRISIHAPRVGSDS